MGQKMHILKREHPSWNQKQKIAVALQYCHMSNKNR